jgi:hypothetical protein
MLEAGKCFTNSLPDPLPSLGLPRQREMSTWLVWTCGVSLNKFRDLETYFQSSWAYLTRPYKFEGH